MKSSTPAISSEFFLKRRRRDPPNQRLPHSERHAGQNRITSCTFMRREARSVTWKILARLSPTTYLPGRSSDPPPRFSRSMISVKASYGAADGLRSRSRASYDFEDTRFPLSAINLLGILISGAAEGSKGSPSEKALALERASARGRYQGKSVDRKEAKNFSRNYPNC
jgi:hypothetical protein